MPIPKTSTGMPRKPPPNRKHVKVSGDEDSPWAPPDWKRVYDNILEMRKGRDAPVDSMGCERAHDEKAEPKVRVTTRRNRQWVSCYLCILPFFSTLIS